MPHPIAQPDPSPPPAPLPPSPLPPPALPPLFAQAHTFAARAFASRVRAVLRQASAAQLRRALARRTEACFRRLSREQLTSAASTDALLAQNPALLKVSEEDVARCYGFAARVGRQWAAVLRRQGYGEWADIAVTVVEEGNYLDTPMVSSTDRAREDESTANDHVSSFTALRALRRHPPVCDRSGLPFQQLAAAVVSEDAAHHDEDTPSGVLSHTASSARKMIRQIDDLALNGGSDWHHGWDAVEEAVRRNRTRLDYSRVAAPGREAAPVPRRKPAARASKRGGTNDGQDAAVGAEGNTKGGGRGARAHRAQKRARSPPGGPARGAAGSDDGSDDAASPRPERAGGGNLPRARERGRPASSLGHETIARDAIPGGLAPLERARLIAEHVHPPWPVDAAVQEEGAGTGEEAPPATMVCGALKDLGATHLWEQTRHLPAAADEEEQPEMDTKGSESRSPTGEHDVIYGAAAARAASRARDRDKRRRRAVARARKERLGRRTVPDQSSVSGYSAALNCSKVEWTEDAEPRRGRERATERGAEAREEPAERRGRWLELDLGECTMEVTEEEPEGGRGGGAPEGAGTKRLLAFRSLEVALRY